MPAVFTGYFLECKHNSFPACYGSEMFLGLLRKAHQGLLKSNLIIQKKYFISVSGYLAIKY